MKQSFYLFMLMFLTIGTIANGQTQPNNGELLVHFVSGTTNADIQAIASNWNSVVVDTLQPGGQLAVLKPVSYPFTNPYDSNDIIVDIASYGITFPKHEPDGDGGVINYFINQGSPDPKGIGQSPGSCHFNLKDALGNTQISVGVFDSGVNYQAANLIGYKFNKVNEVFGDASDNDGHGTHVATILHGTYRQQSNNILLDNLKYTFGNPLNNQGSGLLSEVAYSIEKAVIEKVNVINCSFSYHGLKDLNFNGDTSGLNNDEPMDPLYLVMESANTNTTLFVCSAGNESMHLDGQGDFTNYPAAFPLDNIISVASIDCDKNLSTFSNYGRTSVDIAAYGNQITSRDHLMNLVTMSGTSQAAAFVSGAAVIVGSHLTLFDALIVKCAIMTGSTTHSLLDGKVLSKGYLDIPKAIASINCQPMTREKITIGNNITVSPNPFTSDLSIAFDLQTAQSVSYKIYDLTGNLVAKNQISATAGTNNMTINFDNFAYSNYYILRLESNEFTKLTKLVRF